MPSAHLPGRTKLRQSGFSRLRGCVWQTPLTSQYRGNWALQALMDRLCNTQSQAIWPTTSAQLVQNTQDLVNDCQLPQPSTFAPILPTQDQPEKVQYAPQINRGRFPKTAHLQFPCDDNWKQGTSEAFPFPPLFSLPILLPACGLCLAWCWWLIPLKSKLFWVSSLCVFSFGGLHFFPESSSHHLAARYYCYMKQADLRGILPHIQLLRSKQALKQSCTSSAGLWKPQMAVSQAFLHYLARTFS